MAKKSLVFACRKRTLRGAFSYAGLLLAGLLALALPKAFAQEKPDSSHSGIPFGKDLLRLKNKNQLVGRIKKVSRSELLFDPDGLNDVTVKLRDIAQLAGPSNFYRIETLEGRHYIARLLPSATEGYAQLAGFFFQGQPIIGADLQPETLGEEILEGSGWQGELRLFLHQEQRHYPA